VKETKFKISLRLHQELNVSGQVRLIGKLVVEFGISSVEIFPLAGGAVVKNIFGETRFSAGGVFPEIWRRKLRPTAGDLDPRPT
jgi:hypothetical protein